MNFQKDSKAWLSIILIGLPDLRETLKRNVLTSLAGRMPIRVHIPPLDSDQVKAYVRHRMTVAGCSREVFADDGLLLMSKATGGGMRRLDVLAQQCLETACRGKSGIVDATLVQKAIHACAEVAVSPLASPSSPAVAAYPIVRASALETLSASTPAWLVENLWTARAVGIIGGAPKCCKTWMALEMAVAVASGYPCLGTFAVPLPGPVLLYAAEDSAAALRLRLESLASHYQLDLALLDIHVISTDALRLDRLADQQRLDATLLLHRPALLILDPLVRLHAIDENAAGEIATLLGYLRVLQRKTGTAIALVHHARKNVSANGGAGYSLRGSSDLYAWVDSFLYLRRHHDQLLLTAEHRAASGAGPLTLELDQSQTPGPYLKLASASNATQPSPADPLPERLLQLLAQSTQPRTVESLRTSLQVRNQRLVEALRLLSQQSKVVRLPQGYVLFQNSPPLS